MLLKRIILEDFGLFRGRNELDLVPRTRHRQRRPVVLIGGKNGSGKTTLLDALRLCLYGPLALGTRVSVREYEDYLAERVHRANSDLFQPTAAAVAIEFEYAQAGETSTYFVERRWEQLDRGLRVHLTVKRDGLALDELDREHADDFLRDLIPTGVSQLFFFDGEKIQQLAEGDQDHVALGEAIQGLIGLDHVERLRGDLRLYAGRLHDQPEAEPLRGQQEALGKEKKELEARLVELTRESDEARCRRDRIRQEIAREKHKLAQSGGAFAVRRDSLIAEKDQLGRTISDAEAELRASCEGLLPFTLAAGLCRELQAQLIAEQAILRWQAHEAALRERLDHVKARLGQSLFPPGQPPELSGKHQSAVQGRVERLLDQLIQPPPNLPAMPVLHRIADEDRDRLVMAAGRVANDLPLQLAGIRQRLERSTRRMQEIEEALARIPAESELQPLLDRLQTLHQDLGAAQAAVERAEAAVHEIDLRLAQVARQLGRIGDQLRDLDKSDGRARLVAQVQAALDEFGRTLTASKVAELRDAVVRSFARLWRKGDLVRRIEFDPADLRVTLFDQHGRLIPKHRLSAGEKQIYAIAMLWALAQVSGRPLPVVIDTPLGRLDRDHRGHLVTRYFPHASHQVVILSTDTEIDQEYFRDLGPSVSHAYHLRYDPAESRCVVEEGYFWAQRGKEVAGATE